MSGLCERWPSRNPWCYRKQKGLQEGVAGRGCRKRVAGAGLREVVIGKGLQEQGLREVVTGRGLHEQGYGKGLRYGKGLHEEGCRSTHATRSRNLFLVVYSHDSL